MNKKERDLLIDKCRALRAKGFSLSEILNLVNLPKTTVYSYIRDIPLTPEQISNIEKTRKELSRTHPNPRKGKCIPGREIIKPKSWSNDLAHVVAHFMFDGSINNDGCIYYNTNIYQIRHLKQLMYKLFRIMPKIRHRPGGLYVSAFYNVELSNYIKTKREQIFHHLSNGASRNIKRVFLQAFFDDEGSIYYKGNIRRVRGHQKSQFLLEVIKKLLKYFNIESKIDKNQTEVVITGKKNLINFAKEINFSSKIYINPYRKNGIWKKKLQKRDILNLAIKSYK